MAALAMALPVGAHAAAAPVDVDSAITISPVVAFVTADPGETVTVPVRVQNQTAVAARVEAEVFDIAPRTGEHETFELARVGEGLRSAADWITPHRTDFALGPAEEHTVELELAVPDDAGAGSHEAGLQLLVRPEVSGSELRLDQAIPVPILVTVSGPANRALRVRVVPTDRWRWNGGRVDWDVELENAGDVHEVVSGRLRIDGLLGGDRSVPLDGGILLPGEHRTRRLGTTVRDAPDVLRARARVVLDDHPDATASAPVTVVLPWWLLVLLLVAVAAVAWRLLRPRDDWDDDAPDQAPDPFEPAG